MSPWPRRRRLVTVLLTASTLAAAVACTWLLAAWWRSGEVEGPTARDLAGNAVPFVAPDARAARVRETGELLEAPAQALSVPLHTARVVGGVINPPTLTAAYLYRDFGDPRRPGSGTAVVALHSVRGGQGPGNALVEPGPDGAAPAVRVRAGDRIVVAGQPYVVRSSELLDKAATAADRSIWAGRDGLVVITCFPDPAVALPDQLNLVVRAERAGAGRPRG